MKNSLRILVLLLALVLCMLPVLASCDKPADDPNGDTPADITPMVATDIPDDDFEDKQIAKHPCGTNDTYILHHQLTAPVNGMIGVSLTFYAGDGTVLDRVEFYYENGGEDAKVKDVKQIFWSSQGTAEVIMNDEKNTSFMLKTNK